VALNEADTRTRLIDPVLHARGWTEDLIRREETLGTVEIVDGQPSRQTHGRTDYTLRVKTSAGPQPVAVAILEAKSEDKSPTYGLDQAAVQIASSPKSDSVGRAYAAAMADALKHGSLPVPNHLRTEGDRRMKHHGIGVGYRFLHDYEGDDIEQQYLPDELVDRRDYVPGDQGYEVTIAARIAARDEARRERPRRKDRASLPVASMGDGLKANMEERKRLADTQKRDAGG
jgi:hypothetical protein